MRARLRGVKAQLRSRMHETIPEQGRWLKAVVTGYFAYPLCQRTCARLSPSAIMSSTSGAERFGVAVRRLA